jgi:hypothetical protein
MLERTPQSCTHLSLKFRDGTDRSLRRLTVDATERCCFAPCPSYGGKHASYSGRGNGRAGQIARAVGDVRQSELSIRRDFVEPLPRKHRLP